MAKPVNFIRTWAMAEKNSKSRRQESRGNLE
jgi:hypothetical protein